MFRTYYFTEMPYAYPPAFEHAAITRTTMPNRWLDPDAMHQLYHKYFDIVRRVDELGLDVMFNEHHGTMSNLNAAMPLTMSIAARETKRSRILALGNPVCNRPDPVRIATEMAMIDVVSHGRLEAGFIKGVSYEISATNARPTDMTGRLYEAIDLIVKAWTSHDGPFNWEGEHYHHRQVNIVPRPYQQPHPPIWVTTLSVGAVAAIAERGYTIATMFNGTEACAKIFNQHRETYTGRFGAAPHPDKLAYAAYVLVADSDEEALREAPKIQDFLRQSFRVPKGQMDVPGYLDARLRGAALKTAAETAGDARPAAYKDDISTASPESLVASGLGFYGTPDSVFEQLKAFFYGVGGFGNFLGMFHSSTMSYDLTTRSLELFSKHVLPRFREEVYEPWLKDHGLKRVFLPTPAGKDLGASAGQAITGATRAA
jgi:alkanesulfonate monooxygenase SsuD/methylene tetrahydromethanopterin reductase-like flavin-dependent oxidoreductase (luciferase family)